MIEFLQHLINGLSLGSIYALIALGYTMVFGVLQLINFAHGDITMLGAFIGYYANKWLDPHHTKSSPWMLVQIILLAMTGCALIGFLIEKLAYRPLRKVPKINVLITAVGISLFLEFAGQLFLGSEPKFFPQFFETSMDLHIGALNIHFLQIVVFCVALGLMGILRFIIFRTRLGLAMRAVSFHHDYAALMGIPLDRVISLTFMIGSALAGAAGILIGLTYPKIDPMMGSLPGLKAFVCAVLGGIGNITGAVIGGMVLGLAEEFLVGYWLPSFRDALAFGILIIILLFKPNGILGTTKVEKV
jgi:branched-chain amino acid transport system permease protein